jgi:hypothetical protein
VIKATSRFTILLPRVLPQPVANAKQAVTEKVSQDEYVITLYYESGVGDSGMAASFAADAHADFTPKDIGNVHENEAVSRFGGLFPASWQRRLLRSREHLPD